MLAGPAVALAAPGCCCPAPASDADQQPLGAYTDLAWGGRGPAVIAGFGWMMAVAYCAGLLYWVADRLDGRASAERTRPDRTAAAGDLGRAGLRRRALAALLGTLIRAAVLFAPAAPRRVRPAHRRPAGLSAHDLRRCRDVSTYRALHRLVGEHAVRLIGCYAAVAAVLVTLSCVAALTRTRPAPAGASGWAGLVRAAADLGDTMLGWLPLVVAGLGLLVYRNDTVRRASGCSGTSAPSGPAPRTRSPRPATPNGPYPSCRPGSPGCWR